MDKTITNCLYKEHCNRVVFEHNKYLNLFASPCQYLHPNEEISNWNERNTFKKVEKPK